VTVFKILVKLFFLALVGVALAAGASLLKKARSSAVSFDQWPAVPRNPNA